MFKFILKEAVSGIKRLETLVSRHTGTLAILNCQVKLPIRKDVIYHTNIKKRWKVTKLKYCSMSVFWYPHLNGGRE